MTPRSIERWRPFAALGVAALATTLSLAFLLAPGSRTDAAAIRAAVEADPQSQVGQPPVVEAVAPRPTYVAITGQPAASERHVHAVAAPPPRDVELASVHPTAAAQQAARVVEAPVVETPVEPAGHALASNVQAVRSPSTAAEMVSAVREATGRIAFTTQRDYEALRLGASALRNRK